MNKGGASASLDVLFAPPPSLPIPDTDPRAQKENKAGDELHSSDAATLLPPW